MRDIKFRSWDKEQKKMHYSDSKLDYDMWFSLDSGKVECLQNCAYTDTFGDEHDDWQPLDNIMEYVGQDKNKKDIYEGDIVIYEISCYGEQMGVVTWSNRHCGFVFGECNRRSKSLVTKTSAKNIVVIGNIYENPELLKEIEGHNN